MSLERPQLISKSVEKCDGCYCVEQKEMISLKRERDNLISPAKLKAPISLTSPERVKLTLQNYRLENKQLRDEIAKMQE